MDNSLAEVEFDVRKHLSVQKGSVVGMKNELGFLTYSMPPVGSFDSATSTITTNLATATATATTTAASNNKAPDNDKIMIEKTVDKEALPYQEEVIDQEDDKIKIEKTVDKEALPYQEEEITDQEEEVTDLDDDETPAPPPPEYYSERYKNRDYTSEKSRKKALAKARRAAIDAYLNQ